MISGLRSYYCLNIKAAELASMFGKPTRIKGKQGRQLGMGTLACFKLIQMIISLTLSHVR